MFANTGNENDRMNSSPLQNLLTALLKISNYVATQQVVGLFSTMHYKKPVDMHKLVTSRKVQDGSNGEKESFY